MEKKIPTIRVEFKYLPDFIMSEEYYNKIGKWQGFLKENNIKMKDVKKVHRILMSKKDYPKTAWGDIC